MPSLVEVRETLAAKRRELEEIFIEAGPDLDMDRVTCLEGDSARKAAEINRRNNELSGLGVEHDRLARLEEIAKNNRLEAERFDAPASKGLIFPNGTNGGAARRTSHDGLRQVLEQAPQYKAFREGRMSNIAIELPGLDLKTLVTLSTISPPTERRDLVPMGLEERTIADLMLGGQTDRHQIEYYEETTLTSTAAVVAEGATKPEMTVAYTLRTEVIRKVAETIPATKESLDDVSFLESQLRGRLAWAVKRAEEAELLSGSGVAPHLLGLLNRSGIQTQAKGADPTPDAIYRAIQKVRGAAGSGFAEPTAVVLHPNDWTDVKLLRTADGIYIWGNPSDEGPDRIWGLAVRQTTAMTEGTGLVGAFRPWAEVIRREGLTILMSTEHSTFAAENKVLLIAETRLGLAVYRSAAFCTVSGI